MESTVSNAFLLLGIGMITVFTILALVVVAGNLLIKGVNRYEPNTPISDYASASGMTPQMIAVISAVVNEVTQGKGQVEHIDKYE